MSLKMSYTKLFTIVNLSLLFHKQIDVKNDFCVKYNVGHYTKKVINAVASLTRLFQLLQIFNYKLFVDMTVCDTLGIKSNTSPLSRFYMVYIFASLVHNTRVMLTFGIIENQRVRSIEKIYNGSNWSEREIFDMFGLYFEGNSNMKRLLTDYGFMGFPMRKDFPVIGFKEVSYNAELETLLYLPVSLMQEERIFEIYNPWIRRETRLKGFFSLERGTMFLERTEGKKRYGND